MTPASSGAKNRCISGAAPSTCRRPEVKASKDTLARSLPYYVHMIQPHVLEGKTVLVAAHGNSLRSLIMAIEGLTPEQILKRELETGVPVVYKLKANSLPASVEILHA